MFSVRLVEQGMVYYIGRSEVQPVDHVDEFWFTNDISKRRVYGNRALAQDKLTCLQARYPSSRALRYAIVYEEQPKDFVRRRRPQ